MDGRGLILGSRPRIKRDTLVEATIISARGQAAGVRGCASHCARSRRQLHGQGSGDLLRLLSASCGGRGERRGAVGAYDGAPICTTASAARRCFSAASRFTTRPMTAGRCATGWPSGRVGDRGQDRPQGYRRNKALANWRVWFNKTASSVRVGVERANATMKNWYGMARVRYRGHLQFVSG